MAPPLKYFVLKHIGFMGAFCNSLEILKPKAQRALDLSAVRNPPERLLD